VVFSVIDTALECGENPFFLRQLLRFLGCLGQDKRHNFFRQGHCLIAIIRYA